MKRILAFLIVVLAINISKAQIPLEINQDGNYRTKQDSTWILIDENALEYVGCFPEAIANPGKSILVKEDKSVLRLELIFKKIIKVDEQKIVYNPSERRISLKKSSEEEKEKSYMILFGFISIVLMIMANIFYRDKFFSSIFSSISALFAIIFSFSLNSIALFGVPVFLAGAFAIAIFILSTSNERGNSYVTFAVLYYFFMISDLLFVL